MSSLLVALVIFPLWVVVAGHLGLQSINASLGGFYGLGFGEILPFA